MTTPRMDTYVLDIMTNIDIPPPGPGAGSLQWYWEVTTTATEPASSSLSILSHVNNQNKQMLSFI